MRQALRARRGITRVDAVGDQARADGNQHTAVNAYGQTVAQELGD